MPAEQAEYCVEFKDVAKSFGAKQVFRELSFSAPLHVTTAIVGTSGSGKTTLLQMVNALETPDHGSIRVLGASLPHSNLEQFRRSIGYAVQGAGLFSHLTARENVTLVAKLSGWQEAEIEARYQALLAEAELDNEISSRLPRQLSGGQQQRLGLCRALMLRPHMLLLDEPFSAVDPVTRLGLYESFERLRESQQVSTLLVTHDLREARRLAGYLCIMDEGGVVQFGRPDEVLANPANAYVQRLIESQL